MFDPTNKALAVRTAVASVAALVANAAHNGVWTVLSEVAFLVAAVASNRVAAIRGDMTHFAATTADCAFRTIFHQVPFSVTVQTDG